MVAGALKLFFRELPEPLFPSWIFQQLVEALSESLPFTLAHRRFSRLRQRALKLTSLRLLLTKLFIRLRVML